MGALEWDFMVCPSPINENSSYKYLFTGCYTVCVALLTCLVIACHFSFVFACFVFFSLCFAMRCIFLPSPTQLSHHVITCHAILNDAMSCHVTVTSFHELWDNVGSTQCLANSCIMRFCLGKGTPVLVIYCRCIRRNLIALSRKGQKRQLELVRR